MSIRIPVNEAGQPLVKGFNPPPEQDEAKYQTLRYMFVTEDNHPVGNWQTCKDASQKIMREYLHQRDLPIPPLPQPGQPLQAQAAYAAHWTLGKHLAPSKLTRLLVTGQKGMQGNLERGMEMLHQVEKDFRLVRSQFDTVEGDPFLFLIEGSERWKIAPPMINLYIFLIRNLKFHVKGQSYVDTINSISGYDSQFKERALIGIAHIKKHGYWRVFNKEDIKNYLPLERAQTNDFVHASTALGIDNFSMQFGPVDGWKRVYDEHGCNWIWPFPPAPLEKIALPQDVLPGEVIWVDEQVRERAVVNEAVA